MAPKTVMAVLDKAIHVVGANDGDLFGAVDARLKAGHDAFWSKAAARAVTNDRF